MRSGAATPVVKDMSHTPCTSTLVASSCVVVEEIDYCLASRFGHIDETNPNCGEPIASRKSRYGSGL